ncbi:hypothetical protein E5554_14700 [Sphingobium sp. PAMC28499]|uniref:S8 family serine peptidase n=1 Tax=Sphingobium sp. PAMC28499 TaxID=2565554 RepID=UPI00109D86A9|nr:S8 family serine peptidase [Sphingobium sp. PAMC28499]QCB38962.1 hypothetical protein E5554_14700 [Sphingobium sp. PAMC28499]
MGALRPLILFCAVLICSPIQQASAQASALRIGCTGEEALSADKSSIPYPFDVKRIQRALERLGRVKRVVRVLVIDNAFAGYAIKDGSEVPTVIFPETFFYQQPDGVSRPSQFIRSLGEEKDAETWGHGTHITGLILGGMYGGGLPSIDDLGLPGVRRLFFENFTGKIVPKGEKPREIVHIFMAALKSNTDEWDKDKLLNLDNSDIPVDYRSSPDVVNISLRTPVSSDGNEETYKALPSQFKYSLVVVSAGNMGKGISPLGYDTAQYPAMSDWSKGNMIVVASHDSSLERSEFSNYGEDYVTLAAPGCAIRSWFSGGPKDKNVDEAKAANGTSQAAAIVSFAAVLLKSYSGIDKVNDLRERLITSSRYSWKLDIGCHERKPKAACVKWGSVLDIEAALYVDQDMIEYCVDEPVGSPVADKRPAALGCTTRIALGKITSLPSAVTQCIDPPPYKPESTGVRLSRPAGVRIMPSGKYQVIYRYQLIGNTDSLTACENADAPTDNFAFTPLPAKDQPDGAPIQNGSPVPDGQSWEVPPSRVVRVVTRSMKDEAQ